MNNIITYLREHHGAILGTLVVAKMFFPQGSTIAQLLESLASFAGSVN